MEWVAMMETVLRHFLGWGMHFVHELRIRRVAVEIPLLVMVGMIRIAIETIVVRIAFVVVVLLALLKIK